MQNVVDAQRYYHGVYMSQTSNIMYKLHVDKDDLLLTKTDKSI